MSCQVPREFSVSIKIDQRSELERSGEKIAEALSAVRHAISLLESIRFQVFRPNQNTLGELVKTIDDNRVLSDDFRRQTSTLLGDLEGAEIVSGE